MVDETPTAITLRFAVLLTLANGFLDAHTYLARGGVFANVQTANVILFGIHLTERRWTDAFSRLWPILAFITGVTLASFIKSGRVHRVLAHPLRWTMGIQAAVLAAFGFVPASVPHSLITVPISFLAGTQIGLFRSVGDLMYIPVATTGNLMRVCEAGYGAIVDKDDASREAFRVYGTLIGAFAGAAIAGAFATAAWGVRAIWVSAGCLAVTWVFFMIDERAGKIA